MVTAHKYGRDARIKQIFCAFFDQLMGLCKISRKPDSLDRETKCVPVSEIFILLKKSFLPVI